MRELEKRTVVSLSHTSVGRGKTGGTVHCISILSPSVISPAEPSTVSASGTTAKYQKSLLKTFSSSKITIQPTINSKRSSAGGDSMHIFG